MIFNKVSIGEVVTLRQGFAINKNTKHHMSDEPTDLHLLRIGDMKDGSYSIYVKDTIPAHFIANEDDIIYTRTGQVGLVFRKQHGVIHNNCFSVTPQNEDVLDRGFLFYVLQTKEFYEEANSKASGAAQPDLPHGAFNSISIPLPDIDIQRKISNILKSYDDLIENNQKQIKLLEETAQRLYKEWFVDLRFPGHEDTELLNDLPIGWKKIRLGDLDCKLEAGTRPKGGVGDITVGVPSIGAENVIGLGKYNYSSEKLISREFFSNMKRGILQDRDILIYKDGAYIGRTSLFQDGFPHKEAAVNEHVFLLHTENEDLQYYLFFTLYQHEYFMKMQKLNKNSAQPGINSKSMMSLELTIPDERLIFQFNQLIFPLMRQLFNKAKQDHYLIEARDRLLPKLMSGEIEL